MLNLEEVLLPKIQTYLALYCFVQNESGSGWGPRYTVLICVGPCNSSEIVMAQKQIWSGIPLFPVLVMFLIPRLAETNRAPSFFKQKTAYEIE